MSDFSNAESGQQIEPEERPLSTPVFRHVARVIFSTFILTFIASRVMVILIMDQKVPDFFFYVGKTHVHHLNYGIFLLSGVGAYLLFRRPSGKRLTWATIAYGIGLGLTFDEFGMWVHLGGGYWQRASLDAVVIVGAVFGFAAYAPSPLRFRAQHRLWAIFLACIVAVYVTALFLSKTHWAHQIAPWLQNLEANGPQ